MGAIPGAEGTLSMPDPPDQLGADSPPDGRAALARSRGYLPAWSGFELFCAESGRSSLPARPETVLAYLERRVAENAKASTLHWIVAAIARWSAFGRRGSVAGSRQGVEFVSRPMGMARLGHVDGPRGGPPPVGPSTPVPNAADPDGFDSAFLSALGAATHRSPPRGHRHGRRTVARWIRAVLIGFFSDGRVRPCSPVMAVSGHVIGVASKARRR